MYIFYAGRLQASIKFAQPAIFQPGYVRRAKPSGTAENGRCGGAGDCMHRYTVKCGKKGQTMASVLLMGSGFLTSGEAVAGHTPIRHGGRPRPGEPSRSSLRHARM